MNKAEIWKKISDEFFGVLQTENLPWTSALVSLIALIKENAQWVSWVGFYEKQGEDLWINAYQGKLACLFIPKGKGVCGAALLEEKTLIVEDVHAFSGHIACDPLSRSEIVVPLFRAGKIAGVLDLDSYTPASFNETDKAALESIVLRLAKPL